MSASIASTVCISQFLHFIDGEGIVSLMCTGNRQLRTMLRRNCTDLCFSDVLPGTKFPFEVLSMPHLRALSVIGIKEAPTFLDYERDDDLALSKGSTSLTSLKLDFRNCQGLFMHPRSSSPRLLVRERFPSLTTLKIHGMTNAKIPERLFGEFPETLQTLSIAFAKWVPFCCDGISKLPRNMTSLSITGCNLRDAPIGKVPVVYPPNLLHLELSQLHYVDLVDRFPSTLRSLFFGTGNGYFPHRPKVRMSSFFRFSSLTSLVARGYTVILDEPIPHTLEEFDCEAIERADGSQYEKHEFPSLPKKMKRVPAFFGHKYSLETALDALPNLEILEIRDESIIPKLPSGLKALSCKSEIQISQITFPEGLTSLQLAVPPKSFAGFGENSLLRKLHIGSEPKGELAIRIVKKLPVMSFQPKPKNGSDQFWHQLVNCKYLESLRVDFGNLAGEVEKLDWFWRFKSLTSLTLRFLELGTMQSQSKDMFKNLPTTITELTIDLVAKKTKTLDDKFLREWRLCAHAPRLRSLTIESDELVFVKWGSSFDSLPEGLLKLELSGIGTLTVDACSKLPRSLKCLDLLLYHDASRMTTNHFQNLPKGLARLYFQYCSHTIRESLFSILPKSVVEVSFEKDIDRADGNGDDDDWYLQMNDSARQFVRYNPLCHGYLPPYSSEFSDDKFDSDTEDEVDGEDHAKDE